MILNLYRYRWYIVRNALNDLRFRYAGTGLGIFWNILSPLAQIIIYTTIFSSLMTLKLPGMASGSSFALYLCSGFLPWIAFSECVTRGCNSFVDNANYLKKMPIPEQIFVAQSAMAATFGMLISLLLLIGVSLLLGHPLQWSWLLIPLVAVLFQGLGFGIGLLLSSLNVFFRDIGNILNIVMLLWFWSLPIVYVEDILPAALREILPYIPAYSYIVAFREVFLYGRNPTVWVWLNMLGLAVGASLLGYVVLRKLRPEIRDAI